jgi:hypothetical protein
LMIKKMDLKLVLFIFTTHLNALGLHMFLFLKHDFEDFFLTKKYIHFYVIKTWMHKYMMYD